MKKLWALFLTFLKIGTVTFGGGYAMIPAVRFETVKVRGWMNEEEITDCIAICQSLPGALIMNIAIFVGKKIKGTSGALAAALGMVLPAFASIILIIILLGKFPDNVWLTGALEGIKDVSAAMIAVTAWQLSRNIIKDAPGAVIAGLSFLLIVLFRLSAVWAIIGGGLAGYLEYRYKMRKKRDGK